MIKNVVKILELLGDRLEVCVSVMLNIEPQIEKIVLHFYKKIQ